jgi:hypothetical protein
MEDGAALPATAAMKRAGAKPTRAARFALAATRAVEHPAERLATLVATLENDRGGGGAARAALQHLAGLSQLDLHRLRREAVAAASCVALAAPARSKVLGAVVTQIETVLGARESALRDRSR